MSKRLKLRALHGGGVSPLDPFALALYVLNQKDLPHREARDGLI